MHVITIPPCVEENLNDLMELCNKHPLKIPLTAAAEFLHVKADGLRSAAEKGQLPFGFAWQQDLAGNRAVCIPTVPFYLWYTQSAGFRQ